MNFKQNKDGSCDIEFSWKERWTLFKKGKIHLSPKGLKDFGRCLMQIVVNWEMSNINKDDKDNR
jgi:hypothetical protein